MKKNIGINILIGALISIILIVVSLITIKPNYTYFVIYNNKTYSSTDYTSFSNGNEVISYKKTDKRLDIELEFRDKSGTITDKADIAYIYETGQTLIGNNGKIIEGTYLDNNGSPSYNFNDMDSDEIVVFLKYIPLVMVKHIDNDRINVTTQKIICSILSVFIGYILSFLAYPHILFEKLKKTQNLVVFCIGLTLILCISSAFYIIFTLK